MMTRVLEAIAARLPCRTIETDGKPYLSRYYVWPRREERPRRGRFAIYLHKFHRSDDDRDQHNHPWDVSAALILAGGYREERGNATRLFRPGDINVIWGDDFHRVDLLDSHAGSWSLFVAGRRVQEWGFRDALSGRFIRWMDYLSTMPRPDLEDQVRLSEVVVEEILAEEHVSTCRLRCQGGKCATCDALDKIVESTP